MTHRDTQLAQLGLPPTPIQVWAKARDLTILEPKTLLVRS